MVLQLSIGILKFALRSGECCQMWVGGQCLSYYQLGIWKAEGMFNFMFVNTHLMGQQEKIRRDYQTVMV